MKLDPNDDFGFGPEKHVMFPHEAAEYTQSVIKASGRLLLKEAYRDNLKNENWTPFKYLDEGLEREAIAWLESKGFIKRINEFELERITFPVFEITKEGIDYIFIEQL